MTEELTGNGNGGASSYDTLPDDVGTYLVTTVSGSAYRFELSRRAVTRTPGPGSTTGPHDGVRILRSVERCTVGAAGFWTIMSDDPLVDYGWQVTSSIVSIVDDSDTSPTDKDRGER